MKKFIVNIIRFLFFTSLFYLVALIVWANYAPSMFKSNINYPIGSSGHMYSRLSEIKKYENIDILFLGSSHAYRGFDTRIFADNGYRTFNLGSSAQTPIQTKVLVNRYLELLNPTTVIYEVYPNTLVSKGIESSLDVIANDKNDLHSFQMAMKINDIKTYNTFIYSFIHDLLNLNKSFTEPIIKKKDKYVSGGFVEKELAFYKPSPLKSKKIKFNLKQLEVFFEIIDVIKDKGIKLILVYAPISKVDYNRYRNTPYFDSLMNDYSMYLNFNEIMSLNDSLHFYDSHHLNQNGIELFNRKLIELLKDLEKM